MAGEPAATADAGPRAGELRAKAERLAELCADLRISRDYVATEGGLMRAKLGGALADALFRNAALLDEAGELAMTGYRAAAGDSKRPRRRNRVQRRIDQGLDRLRSIGRALIIDRSGLWQGGEGRLARLRAMAGYARRGGDPEVQPKALFDQGWYLAQRADIAGGRTSPLVHYLLQGASEGADPHPLFRTRFYADRNAEALGASGLTALEHFVRVGAAEGRDPHPLFDVRRYLRQAPDLIASGENPLTHYLRSGAAQGLSPHTLFDPGFYQGQLEAAGSPDIEPSLAHYLAAGSAMGLRPHPLFDPAWYREQYPDIAATGLEPLTHYVLAGGAEGRSPGPWFDAPRYIAMRGGDLAGRNPLIDYLQGGAWAVAEPWPGKADLGYLPAAAEFGASGLTPLEHWARQSSGQIPTA